MKSGGRILQLDVLRGVAILLVLFRHPVVLATNAGWLSPAVQVLERFGWTGVDLFFVLSGFLVGGLLFREIRRHGAPDARRFLVRRALKIWPTYFLFLAVILLRDWHHGTFRDAITPLLPNFLHLQNYLGTPQLHTWSLAVEEHFYLSLILLLVLLCRFGRIGAIPVFTAFVCTGCLVFRLAQGSEGNLITHLAPTHLRIDSLCFGVFLAYLHHFRPDVLEFVPKARGALLAAGILLITPMLFIELNERFVWTIGFTLLYLGYGCILLACLDARTGWLGRLLTGPAARVLGFIGFFSYSIYLWHWAPLRDELFGRLHTFERAGAVAYCGFTMLYIGSSVALGAILSKVIEQPVLILRDRLFPSRTPAGALARGGPTAGRAPTRAPDHAPARELVSVD